MAYVLNKMFFYCNFIVYKCDMVLLMVAMYIVIIFVDTLLSALDVSVIT